MAEAVVATGALETAGGECVTKTAPQYSYTNRVKYALAAFAIQKFLLAPSFMIQNLYDRFISSHADIIKTYPAKKSLPIR